jgi:hypothetical protein
VEIAFEIFKTRLEVERFRSEKLQAIAQDVYAMAFLLTFEAIIDKVQDRAIRQQYQPPQRKYQYQLKKTAAFTAIIARFPQLLLYLDISPIIYIQELQKALQRQIEPIRPGRSFPSKKLTQFQRLKYNLYQKKKC